MDAVLRKLLTEHDWQRYEVKGGNGSVTLVLHHDEEPAREPLGIVCGECDKVFPSARSRGIHLRVHRVEQVAS